MDEDTSTGRGVASAPDAVWEAVRADYLSGRSATECCRRHGVGLTSLRNRAAREGWRRADQPWAPPDRLDPWDEGVELDQKVGGDLDRVELYELSYVAHRRMMRAVMRGDAMEALRWRRVRQAMDEEEAEIQRECERQDAEIWRRLNTANEAREVDGLDGLDGVFESGDDAEENASSLSSFRAQRSGDPEQGGARARDPVADTGVSDAGPSPRFASAPPGRPVEPGDDESEVAAATSETRTDLTPTPAIRDPGSLPPGAFPCPSPAPRS